MKLFFFAIALIVSMSACTKSNNSQTVINVSCQQYTDALGNALEQVGFCPLTPDSSDFTQQELSLFTSLDTADLSGTTNPASSYTFGLYPNPISSKANIFYEFNDGFSGQVVVKYVITDSVLNPVYKFAGRLSFVAPNSASFISMQFPIPAGRFRLFQTLSAGTYNNFSRNWINITKTN